MNSILNRKYLGIYAGMVGIFSTICGGIGVVLLLSNQLVLVGLTLIIMAILFFGWSCFVQPEENRR